MKFYAGMHQPSDADRVPRAFISVNRLAGRRSPFAVNDWIMDSGAFTTIAKHGGYPEPVETYAEQIDRWRTNGNLERAVSQDWMCEPWMLERTGKTVAAHLELTVERYAALERLCGDIVMPVVQGYAAADYRDCVRLYGALLAPGAWVGIGSVCKRQGNPSAIAEVLDAVLTERPDLRLHGFGVKILSLACASVRDRLYSADSMAWSYHERINGRSGNHWSGAARYADRVDNQAVQECLFR